MPAVQECMYTGCLTAKTITDDADLESKILLQAVAVIESSRSQIDRTLNESVSYAYWNIGKLLYDRKFEGKHGDSVVKRLSYDLKTRFPHIGLSPRQLWSIKRFSTAKRPASTSLE